MKARELTVEQAAEVGHDGESRSDLPFGDRHVVLVQVVGNNYHWCLKDGKGRINTE